LVVLFYFYRERERDRERRERKIKTKREAVSAGAWVFILFWVYQTKRGVRVVLYVFPPSSLRAGRHGSEESSDKGRREGFAKKRY